MDQTNEECCVKFSPELWDQKEFTWQNKLFLKDTVPQIFHIPVNFGKVVTRMWKKIEAADAKPKEFLMLAYDPSPWKCELYITIDKEIPGGENVTMSGDYLTKVYDGPFQECGKFFADMQQYVTSKGKTAKKIYFNYIYCPKCAKKFGHNYIVAFAEV